MTLSEPVDVKPLLQSRNPMQMDEFLKLRRALSADQVAATRIEIDALIRASEAGGTPVGQIARAGIGAHLLGQHKVADRLLSQVSGDPVALFVHALVYLSLDLPKEAEEKFAAAQKAGFDTIDATLRRAGAIRMQGRLEDAEKTLRSTGTEGARRAEYSYQMGCILSDRGDTYGAIEYFERAVDMDPHHPQALFRLAGENALHGNDNEAIRLYEQALSKPPYYLGALINLGLLYEDKGNYAAAAFCFRRVLVYDPEHERARMYMKDIEATQEMFFDDDMARNEARLSQLLSRPVTDFELSVRSRNCLAGMNILTLGDLTRVTEQDLLGGKNFGETSLVEIRELMAQHGLRVGQNLAVQKPVREAAAPAAWSASLGFLQQPDLSPQEQALMSRPVSDLNLSVRARKCMARLGITTLGELTQRTPDELLATKNFGVTSLNEIRQQLAEHGIKLRND
ncbi:MAG: DNA-directed RNA polymerase subunit alpha C-terminal domain-containing protein [Planctomycetaceae bacterium]|nr:DNA-directed RNA polymerase subunit alpha C-terminal domain-containing protein [Planctomycetaceae bacterium]